MSITPSSCATPTVADEVKGLYAQAGLNLKQDLAVLAKADRIAADPAARAELASFSTFTGEFSDPMLTLHTAGDQQVVVEQENAYAATVRGAGNRSLLRQAFTERAFHCAFTPAEMLAAFGAITDRVRTGSWKHVTDRGHPAGQGDRAGSGRQCARRGRPDPADSHRPEVHRPEAGTIPPAVRELTTARDDHTDPHQPAVRRHRPRGDGPSPRVIRCAAGSAAISADTS